jgi:S-DNA-T family DNA segregation ATPase FtsK/SpoIIIE
LIDQAIQVIAETRKASATLLQRKLWVGFARAARIMDILEERGIIWPAEGAKPRDIFL